MTFLAIVYTQDGGFETSPHPTLEAAMAWLEQYCADNFGDDVELDDDETLDEYYGAEHESYASTIVEVSNAH